MSMQDGKPELIELGADWRPWKFQVNTFGNAIDYGHREDRIIRTGMSNFETREEAEAVLKLVSKT